ncbi:hypothetical protein EMPS_05770 [Entomortierella parvispora]|uniref:F-box domain-containing protein n=1 Tax=Entomortierella parvispora TaxID=205924 RepID=A0A9P3HBQ5_9FUNG|nr:hypothetical protein EMPS_05770 [Entomortierella parvispora]
MITGNKALEGSDELWRALASCPSLESLSISKLHVSHRNWHVCWPLWSRLTCLRLLEASFSSKVFTDKEQENNDNQQQPQHHPSQPLSLYELLSKEDPSRPTKLKTLELRLLQGIERLQDHLALLRFCPDLETFIWFVNPEPFTGKLLEPELERHVQYCPKLTNITLGIDYRNEDILIRFLESGASLQLQEMNLPRAQFGFDTWKLLREHHWSTLRILDVSAFAGSSVVQDMLCSLTGLVSFTAYMIRSGDMMQDARPWVCLGLERLVVAIEIQTSNVDNVDNDDVDVTQKAVMERLSTLVRLQYLQLRPIYGQSSLQFRLTGSLGCLETWRDLRTLILHHVPQELKEDDVHWMIEKWPRLHSVIGGLHPLATMDTALKGILTEKKVQIRQVDTNVRIS